MLLRTEGMISTGRGRRSTVLARSDNNDFDSTISISAWLRYFGYTPGQRTLFLARKPADETTAGHLRITPGDHIVTLRRLRLADDRPFAIERTYFPVPVGRHILDADGDIVAHIRPLISGRVEMHPGAAWSDLPLIDAVFLSWGCVLVDSPVRRPRM